MLAANINLDREYALLEVVPDYESGTFTFAVIGSDPQETYQLVPCEEKYQVRVDRTVDFQDYQLDPENPNRLIFDNPLTVGQPGYFSEDNPIECAVFKGNTRLLAIQRAFDNNLDRYRENPESTADFWIFPTVKVEFLTEEECSNPEYLFTLSRLDNQVAKTTVRDQVYQVVNYFALQQGLLPDSKLEEIKQKVANYFKITVATVNSYRKTWGLLQDHPEVSVIVESGELSVTSVVPFIQSYDKFIAAYPATSFSLSEFIALCQKEALLQASEDSTVGKVPPITPKVVSIVLDQVKPVSQDELIAKEQESVESSQKEKKASVQKLERERIKTLDTGKLATEFYQLAESVQNDFLPLIDLPFGQAVPDVADPKNFVAEFLDNRLSTLKQELTSIYSPSEAKRIMTQLSVLRTDLNHSLASLYSQIALFESFFDEDSPKYQPTAEQRKLAREAKKAEKQATESQESTAEI